MKRICFVHLTSYGYFNEGIPAHGGAQRQIYLLSTHLRDQFDVHCVVGDYGQPKREEIDGITFHRAYKPGSNSQSRKPLEFFKLFQAMKRANADLYVARGNPRKAAFVYLISTMVSGDFAYSVGNDPDLTEDVANLSPSLQYLFIRAIRNASVLIAQTPNQAEILESGYNVSSNIIPNGYPLASDLRPHDERRYFLWVGRMREKQKQPHIYLELAAQLPEYEFLLVGPDGPDAEYNEEIRTRAAELDNVRDIGFVPPSEIHDFYRDAIALLNTSEFEGFPNTFLEAWRYDTPVISLSVDPDRFIEPSIDGCADNEFENLVTLTNDLGKDTSRRHRLGTTAGEYLRENLSMESIASKYAEAFASAID